MKIQKLIMWGTVAAGITAAYLMFKRGEGLGTIVAKAASNPVGSLVNELRGARG